MISTITEIFVSVVSVILAVLLVKGLIPHKSKLGFIIQAISGVAIIIFFLVIWGRTGHDPLQWTYCYFDKGAQSCVDIEWREKTKTSVNIDEQTEIVSTNQQELNNTIEPEERGLDTQLSVPIILNESNPDTAIQAPNTASAKNEPRNDQLSPHGFGSIKFGYLIESVEASVGEKVFSRQSWKGGHDSCYHAEFSKYPGVMLMVMDGVVERADVEVGVPNILNIRVGDSLAKVKKLYPSVKIEPHQYVENGHYLIFPSRRGGYAMVLEEDEGFITSIRAGTDLAVHLVEHCL